MHTNNKKKGRVILTSARNIMTLAVAHSLGRKGIEVIGTDCVRPNLLQFSKFVAKTTLVSNYKNNPGKYIEDLLKVVKNHKPDDDRPFVLMPVFRETLLVAEHKEMFAPHVIVACPDYSVIDKVYPKDHLFQTARKYDVHIPPTRKPKSRKDLREPVNELNFPMFVKPYNESGGRGMHLVRTREELEEAFDKNLEEYGHPSLIQEIARGTEYSLTGIYQRGDMKASMAYHNLRSVPPDAGSGVISKSVDPKPFEKNAKRLMSALGWHGLAQMDLIWNEKEGEEPYLIEVNPRFWAGIFNSIESGIDYPWLNYLMFTEGEIPQSEPSVAGKKTRIPVGWVFNLIQESMRPDLELKEIAKAGKRALKELGKGDLKTAGRAFFKYAKENLKNRQKEHGFKAGLKEARDAESVLNYEDDPWAPIGLLYVVAYLLKYGEMPPEINV